MGVSKELTGNDVLGGIWGPRIGTFILVLCLSADLVNLSVSIHTSTMHLVTVAT